MKRGRPLARRTRLPVRSATRARMMVARRALVAGLLEAHPWCPVRVPDVCTGRTTDVHELLSRGRGGSILDEENCTPVCRACHDWITTHPAAAAAAGWARSREGD